LTVRWEAPAPSDGFSITHYHLSSEPVISDLPKSVSTTGPITVADVNPCTSYVFTVRAYDANMHIASDPTSSEVFETSALVRTAVEGLSVTNVDPRTQSLSWKNASLSCPFFYRIQYWPDGFDQEKKVLIAHSSVTYTSVDSLKPETLYHYQIQAIASPGLIEGPMSTEVTMRTMSEKPNAPTKVTVEQTVNRDVGQINLTVRWEAPAPSDGFSITHYHLSSEPVISDLPKSVSTTGPITVADVNPCTSYVFTVRAYDANMHIASDPTSSEVFETSALVTNEIREQKQAQFRSTELKSWRQYKYEVQLISGDQYSKPSVIEDCTTAPEPVAPSYLSQLLQLGFNLTMPTVTGSTISLNLNLDALQTTDMENLTLRVQPKSELNGIPEVFSDNVPDAQSWEDRKRTGKGPWDILISTSRMRSVSQQTHSIVLGEPQCNTSEYCKSVPLYVMLALVNSCMLALVGLAALFFFRQPKQLPVATVNAPVENKPPEVITPIILDEPNIPVESFAVPIDEFPNYAQQCLEPNDKTLENQYAKIQAASAKNEANGILTKNDASSANNRALNRYKDILPFGSKVLTMDRKTVRFIATQAPLENTFGDFWKMVLDQDVSIIVMLTNLQEAGVTKAHQYWPPDERETKIYSSNGTDIAVTLRSEISEEDANTHRNSVCIVRKFSVVSAAESNVVTVTQLHFINWPDHGSPTVTDFEQLMKTFHQLQRNTKSGDKVTLVHCSAGVGRTGTFITADILLRCLKAGDRWVDIGGIVQNLRLCRMCMVQKSNQYEFLHQYMAKMIDESK
uniref:Protein-tyrosine-phosphatase n=1 Tax=Echinostoma caproni TaxID=27848 RepID=A0A183ADX7_9TREM